MKNFRNKQETKRMAPAVQRSAQAMMVGAQAASTPALKLRPVLWQADLSAMLDIERAGFAIPWNFEKFLAFSCQANGCGLVADGGGRGPDAAVAGFMLYERYEDSYHVAHIAVHPLAQNRGIGRLMLTALCDDMPVTLNVRRSNSRAQQLYRHLGFTVVQERPAHYDNGEDALVMRFGSVSSDRGFKPGFSLSSGVPLACLGEQTLLVS
jgi:[ribosomal protein S18]-alanine N-acetyltransferase